MTKIINRDEIIKNAIHDCYVELYAKAQPMADYDNLVAEMKAGKIDEKKDGPVYERHYISQEELDYIVNKYIDAYRMTEHWISDIETLEEYLINGGYKNAYVDEFTDDNGNHHSGYRSYEHVVPIKKQISNIVEQYNDGEYNTNTQLIEDLTNKVMETIKSCKDFYRFDREANDFKTAIYLGASPCTDIKGVKEWWKNNYNIDIEIEEHNPKLFWYYDNGYTDEDLAEEFEDLGENWKEELDKQWHEEQEAEKRKHAEAIEEINKQIEELKNNAKT